MWDGSLAVKMLAYVRINRIELAETALRQMRQVDEDNCLTQLCHAWLMVSPHKTLLMFFFHS